jgi:hypothetical protein
LTYDLVVGCLEGISGGCEPGKRVAATFGVARSVSPGSYRAMLRVNDEDLAKGSAVDEFVERGVGGASSSASGAFCPNGFGETVAVVAQVP